MAFCLGREAEVVDWLIWLGCRVTRRDEAAGEYQFVGLVDGIGGNLNRGMSPLDMAIGLGFIVGGELWALLYPHLLELADKAWKDWKKDRAVARTSGN